MKISIVLIFLTFFVFVNSTSDTNFCGRCEETYNSRSMPSKLVIYKAIKIFYEFIYLEILKSFRNAEANVGMLKNSVLIVNQIYLKMNHFQQ